MKKLLIVLSLIMASVSITSAASASDWFGSNNGKWKMGPNGPYWDESDWPEWTPMYWMQEFFDSWDDNNNYYGGYGAPYGNYGGGYGMPYAPYGGVPPVAPYGYMPPAGAYQYQYPSMPVPSVPVK